MARVLICSEVYFPEDMEFVIPETLEIERDVQISRLDNSVDFHEKARRADLVLFFLTGDNLARFMNKALNDPQYKELFSKKGPRLALWSYDSHHMHHLESPLQRYFDGFYISHESCRQYFSPDNLTVIPCAHLNSIKGELNIQQYDFEMHRDLCFPYGMYEWSPRNTLAYEAEKIFRRKDLNYMFGSCFGDIKKMGEGGNFRWLLSSSKICFNLSLLDDFNMRNFEAQACNRVLLTNKVAEHDIVDMDLSHTFFFQRDLSDLPQVLEKALEADVSTCDSAKNVLHNHMLIHRFLFIINRELGTEYKVNIPVESTTEKVHISENLLNMGSDDVVVYDRQQLAVNAVSACIYEKKYPQANDVYGNFYTELCQRGTKADAEQFSQQVYDTISKSFRIPQDGPTQRFLKKIRPAQ
ncbi:MAG: hypothetical protein ACNI27_01605 [Desulfovibrio sp.]